MRTAWQGELAGPLCTERIIQGRISVSASGNGEGGVPDGGVESHPADNIVYSICSVRAMMSSCASGESAVKKAE